MQLRTMAVKDQKGGLININEIDFNPAIHTRVDATAQQNDQLELSEEKSVDQSEKQPKQMADDGRAQSKKK